MSEPRPLCYVHVEAVNLRNDNPWIPETFRKVSSFSFPPPPVPGPAPHREEPVDPVACGGADFGELKMGSELPTEV